MVPSVMDSPICGIRTSVPGPAVAPAPLPDAGARASASASSSRMAVSSALGVTVSSFVGTAPEFAGAADCAPSSLIVATTVLTPTVAPSCTLISPSVPAMGEGISASTLSVEISNSGSSRWTVSPGFFSHLVRVPSVMDSPIWGMTTSVGIGRFSGVRWVRKAQLWIIRA